MILQNVSLKRVFRGDMCIYVSQKKTLKLACLSGLGISAQKIICY